jgi:hypothetical protein
MDNIQPKTKKQKINSSQTQYQKIPILKPDYITTFTQNNEILPEDTDMNMETPITQANDNTFNYSNCFKDLNIYFVVREYRKQHLDLKYF